MRFVRLFVRRAMDPGCSNGRASCECDFGLFGNADGTHHAMTPCPRSSEIGSFVDGDDRGGAIVKRFPSPAASLGFHRSRPIRALSTCPSVNKLGCYELDYVVTRVRSR